MRAPRLFLTALLLSTVALTGCSLRPHWPHFESKKDTEQASRESRQWFLDPSTEFGSYKTYGFLQVTAVRYQDPILSKAAQKKADKAKMPWDKKDKRVEIHHTDELIWRVLADELQKKGYAQIAPEKADLWVIYYGGPRPVQPMENLAIHPHPFDNYFAQNELTEHTFFVDVIDAKRGTLIYRGWDNTRFKKKTPEAQQVVDSATEVISFFPSLSKY